MRVTRHLLETATTAAPAKEIRLFGLGPVLVGASPQAVARDRSACKIATAACAGVAQYDRLERVRHRVRRCARRSSPTAPFNGQASPGDVVLALTLAAQVNDQVADVVQMVTWLIAGLKTVGRYLWLVDYSAAANGADRRRGAAARPSGDRHRLRLTSRSGIPAPRSTCCRDVDLHIPAGDDGRHRGRQRRRQVDAGEVAVSFLRPDRGRDSRRRRRPAPHRPAAVARPHVGRVPGLREVRTHRPRDGRRGPALVARRRGRGARRSRSGLGRRGDRVVARRVRHPTRQELRSTAPSCRAGSGRSSRWAGR